MSGLEPDALRSAVREILIETLASRDLSSAGAAGEALVAIRDDADLNAFAARLLELFEQPAQREALRSGRLRFRLAGSVAPVAEPPAGALLVERGALTEKVVARAANEGRRLVLGRGAVATPLALDKARALGIEVERTG